MMVKAVAASIGRVPYFYLRRSIQDKVLVRQLMAISGAHSGMTQDF